MYLSGSFDQKLHGSPGWAAKKSKWSKIPRMQAVCGEKSWKYLGLHHGLWGLLPCRSCLQRIKKNGVSYSVIGHGGTKGMLEMWRIDQMEQIRWMAAFIMLGVNSIRDLRTKTIFIRFTVLSAVTGIGFCLFDPGYPVTACLTGMLPGLATCFLAFMTKETIGYGDGIVMIAMGTLIGAGNCLAAAMTAVVLSGVTAFFLLLSRRAKKQDQIAFVPFLFLGVLMVKGALCTGKAA